MIQTIVPVSSLATYLKDLVESDEVLADMWIEGEVSSFSVPASGHGYFTIKDDRSSIDCVIWKQQRVRQSFQPRVGDKIVVHGGTTVYERTSRLQIRADVLYPAGAGIQQLQLEQLRQRLEAEGIFDIDRKRPLPLFPERIGVVTSSTGSVWHDILRVLERRYPLAEVVLSPASVQGETAPESVVEALARLLVHGVDVIIMARGGGSAEDLWAFNDERIVRAIFASPVPVISAIGHETDTTLSDYVADMRAPTPSVAAEIVSPDLGTIDLALTDIRGQLQTTAVRSLQRRREALAVLQFKLATLSPANQLVTMASALERERERLDRATVRALDKRKQMIERQALVLQALDPAALLRRGYAWVSEFASDQPVRSVGVLTGGDTLRLTFGDGTATVHVDGVTDPTIG